MSGNALQVHFLLPDGSRRSVAANPGDRLMHVAVDNGLPGIIGQCGGGCTCCTCHCWVEEPWAARLPEPTQDELDLLIYALGFNPSSRLSCQIDLDETLDGLVVRLPAEQA